MIIDHLNIILFHIDYIKELEHYKIEHHFNNNKCLHLLKHRIYNHHIIGKVKKCLNRETHQKRMVIMRENGLSQVIIRM